MLLLLIVLVVLISSPLWTARTFEPILALIMVLLIIVYAFPWELATNFKDYSATYPSCSTLPLGWTWSDDANATAPSHYAGSNVLPLLKFKDVEGKLRFSPSVSALFESAVRNGVTNQMVQDNVNYIVAIVSPLPPMITWLLLLAFNLCKCMHQSHLLIWDQSHLLLPHASGHCLFSNLLPSDESIIFSMVSALVVILFIHNFHRQSFLIKRLKDQRSAMRIEQLKAEKQRLEYERMMVEQFSHRLIGTMKEQFHDDESIDPSET